MKRALPVLLLLIAAGCQKPKPLTGKGFSLMMPARWHVVTDDKDYDPEHRFSLKGPAGMPAHVVFHLYDETLEPARRVDAIANSMIKNHPQATRSPFGHWGQYDGAGVELRYDSEGVPVIVRFFAWSGHARSFVVIETSAEKYESNLKPTFAQVASSFVLTDH
jgi:hypothetical protein